MAHSLTITTCCLSPTLAKDYDNVDAVRGMNISITTTAKSDEEGRALLDAFSFPFKK